MEIELSTGEQRRPRARTTDVTVVDWLDAGQSLLKNGGLGALKLHRLTAELGMTTGSFYHHFVDFDAFKGYLADYFGTTQITTLLAAVERQESDPLGRIRLLSAVVERHNMRRLGLAMRAWAESDQRARRSVEQQDDRVLAFLVRCLTKIGFSAHDAAVRGYTLIAVGLGVIHAPKLKGETLNEDLIQLLCVPSDQRL